MSANLTNFYKYGPYGEPKDANNVDSWSGERFRYTGQIMIPEAKLYDYKARVYDPIAGRFLQTDPVGSKDDLDLYAYVHGDPINHTDPTGLDCHWWGGCDTKDESAVQADTQYGSQSRSNGDEYSAKI
ncbi:hypothetical protein AEAC466_13570 [Asticcacaulis sp. AC466]|uniref:RHS repeat-associated core domain-containing protein n=1 Tax=Asticcacaulis sp. AC466 TaxID=1282362 RepID=UPI0003C3D24A|nr:RHS repeat-associated core domain-containing protein [Asticcacaulis sp. AC466]ESQ83275.1 hypothetical protein AEAC466_13570 [Asticcacaulis sp. AC466]